MNNLKINNNSKARNILITGVIFMVSIGVLYSWSVIKQVIEAEWGWTSTGSGLPFSLVLMCFATGNLIGGRVQMKIAARIVGTIGAVMTGFGLVLCGLIGDNFVLVTLSFGVITGFGIGFGYSSYLPTVLRWYHPEKKGFVSGWIIGGFGLTALYLAPLASLLIDRFGLQPAFVILGIKTLVVSIPLAQFIKNPPVEYVPPEPKNIKQKTVTSQCKDVTWTQMISTGQFYLLFFMFLCSVSIGQMVIGNITGIAGIQANLTDPAVLAGLVAFMALVNAAGRVIGGIISDKIGWVNVLLIVFTLHFANMLGFGFYSSLPLIILGVTFAGLCFGATLSVYPAITVECFGIKNYGINYGIMYMAFGFAGIAAPVIAGYFFDLNGNYNSVYMICAAGMVIMILANLTVRRLIIKKFIGVVIMSNNHSPPQYPHYPQQNLQYVQVYVKPKIRGRGFGISSMVLGIIGVVYSLVVLLMAFTTVTAIKMTVGFNDPGYLAAITAVIVMAVIYSVFAILACVFSLVAMSRGYKNGVSISGLVLSLISFACLISSVIIVIALAA